MSARPGVVRRSSPASLSSGSPTAEQHAPDVTVRRATDDDLGRIRTLLQASRRELGDTPAAQYLVDALGLDNSDAAAMLGDRHATVFIGAFAGADCGIAIARLGRRSDDTTVVTVPWIYVETGFRRSGVADSLVAEVRAWVARSGGGVLDVIAAPGDRATKSLLEMSGMKARAIVMSQSVLADDGGDSDR
jgi:hypothetical protein